MIDNASKHSNHSRDVRVNSLTSVFSTGAATQHKFDNKIKNLQIKPTTRPFGGAAILDFLRETQEEEGDCLPPPSGGKANTLTWGSPSGEKQNYTLKRSPVHHRTNLELHKTADFVSSINIICAV